MKPGDPFPLIHADGALHARRKLNNYLSNMVVVSFSFISTVVQNSIVHYTYIYILALVVFYYLSIFYLVLQIDRVDRRIYVPHVRACS